MFSAPLTWSGSMIPVKTVSENRENRWQPLLPGFGCRAAAPFIICTQLQNTPSSESHLWEHGETTDFTAELVSSRSCPGFSFFITVWISPSFIIIQWIKGIKSKSDNKKASAITPEVQWSEPPNLLSGTDNSCPLAPGPSLCVVWLPASQNLWESKPLIVLV